MLPAALAALLAAVAQPADPGSPASPPAAAPEPAPAAATSPATQPATQPATRPALPLPAHWHGHFVGTVELLRPGRGATADPVHMELIITPHADDPLKVGWTIVYGTGDARQERPYELAAVPGFPNRFLMDERNGIFVDHALFGSTLVSEFRVNATLLLSRFERTADGIHVEIYSFQTTPSRRSGPHGTDIDVESYPATTLQRGLLRAK